MLEHFNIVVRRGIYKLQYVIACLLDNLLYFSIVIGTVRVHSLACQLAFLTDNDIQEKQCNFRLLIDIR